MRLWRIRATPAGYLRRLRRKYALLPPRYCASAIRGRCFCSLFSIYDTMDMRHLSVCGVLFEAGMLVCGYGKLPIPVNAESGWKVQNDDVILR